MGHWGFDPFRPLSPNTVHLWRGKCVRLRLIVVLKSLPVTIYRVNILAVMFYPAVVLLLDLYSRTAVCQFNLS